MATTDLQEPATKQFQVCVPEHIPIVTEAAVTVKRGGLAPLLRSKPHYQITFAAKTSP
jgi:hypothetical protein